MDPHIGSMLGQALKGGLEPLAYLIQAAQSQHSGYGFLSHLCNFVVPSIRKEPALQGIREGWANERSNHVREERALQKAAIKEVTQACQNLKARLKKSKIKTRQSCLDAIVEVEKILETGGEYLGPAFYETAANKLWHLCSCLAADAQQDILAGIADIEYIDKSDWEGNKVKHWKQPHLAKVYFKESIAALHEHQQIMGWDRIDNAWVVWEYLCLAEQCWHLPQSYFETQGLPMGSATNVQRSNQLFNLRGYWCEMQGIRQQRASDHGPITFTRERYFAYLSQLTSAIILFHALREADSSVAETSPIYALELKLHQNELHLIVEWQKEGETSTYILHTCQEGAVPLKYLQKLFNNVGKKVSVADIHPGGQSAAKVLTALKIEGPLRKLFFSKGETHATTLIRTRAVLSEQVGIDPIKVTQHVSALGLTQLEGSFSRINYRNCRGRSDGFFFS